MVGGADSPQAVAVPQREHGAAVLDLRLGELRQLFNSMEDPKAADFIVDWATEVPAEQALSMVMHLGTPASDVAILGDAVREYFQRRPAAKRRELSKLFKVGRVSPVIGGWVALWRPLEIFLYDWWPLRAQAKLYDRLGRMQVSVA